MSSPLTRLRIAFKSSNADGHALTFLDSDDTVEVIRGTVIEFRPRQQHALGGIIFYQGGRCDPLAYAPLLRPLAVAGFHVFVPQMALRMAVTGANKAANIMRSSPEQRRWFIGGHSMGGSMAAGFAKKHQTELDGLFMIGSYAAAMHAMPDSDLPVLVINGTQDLEVRQSELDAQPDRLPAHTRHVSIVGGDHYQFGSFAGENVNATISRDDQQAQTVTSLLNFVNTAADNNH